VVTILYAEPRDKLKPQCSPQIDAFDVIGELTFSKPLGFLEKGGDVDGIITALEHMLDYSGKVCVFFGIFQLY